MLFVDRPRFWRSWENHSHAIEELDAVLSTLYTVLIEALIYMRAKILPQGLYQNSSTLCSLTHIA